MDCYFTSTIFFAVSLLGYFCGVVFSMKVSVNFLMIFKLESLMNANAVFGAGFYMVYIRSIEVLVPDSLLDVPGILLCLGGNSTVSAIRLDFVLLSYTV